MMITRTCVICGAPFEAYPSDTKRTCSEACSCRLRSRVQTGSRHPWSAEARERRREEPKPPQLALGTQAALALTEGQRGPGNRACKVWRLRSPEGHDFEVVGLLPWARENAWRFGEEGEEGAHRIASGLKQVARAMKGKTKRAVGSYKGWTLTELPRDKEGVADMGEGRRAPRDRGNVSPITRARMAVGLTQAQLAERIGCTQKDVSRWERGMYKPGIDKLVRMAEAIGCTVDELVR